MNLEHKLGLFLSVLSAWAGPAFTANAASADAPSHAADGLVKTLMTTRGKQLVNESFAELPKVIRQPAKGFASGFTGWRFNGWERGGKWDVVEGAFRGIEHATSLHPATASYGFRFKDVVIQCDVRLHDVPPDGRRSRYFQVRTTDETEYVSTVYLTTGGLVAQKEDHDHDGPDKAVLFGKIQRPVKLGEWQTVLIEIQGEELVATLDGRSVTGSHPLIGSDKHSIMFVSGTEGSVRNFRVWEALPNPDWAKNKAALVAAAAPARATPPAGGLKSALLFHASFDRDANADFAAGDARVYSAVGGKRAEAKPGLPEGDLVQLDKNAGRFGGALHFTQKMKPQVFFRGAKNLGYRAKDWSGSCSLWMRIDPDKDLEPGYCDPLQFVGQAWGEGNMFVEFSKDHTPRHFRYALLPITRLWNPANRKWEDIPEPERPMVPVHQPPFRRDQWTHVCFTFGNANTGRKDGWGRLYLDGKLQGAFTGYESSFNWDEAQSALTLGLNYIGWYDDVAVFNRVLTDAEVRTVFQAKDGIRSLK